MAASRESKRERRKQSYQLGAFHKVLHRGESGGDNKLAIIFALPVPYPPCMQNIRRNVISSKPRHININNGHQAALHNTGLH